MSVSLSHMTEQKIRDWIDTGRFNNADAVVERALEALEEQEKLNRLRELVRAGFESGPGVELTDEVWEEMEREVDEAFLRGDQPPAHVRP